MEEKEEEEVMDIICRSVFGSKKAKTKPDIPNQEEIENLIVNFLDDFSSERANLLFKMINYSDFTIIFMNLNQEIDYLRYIWVVSHRQSFDKEFSLFFLKISSKCFLNSMFKIFTYYITRSTNLVVIANIMQAGVYLIQNDEFNHALSKKIDILVLAFAQKYDLIYNCTYKIIIELFMKNEQIIQGDILERLLKVSFIHLKNFIERKTNMKLVKNILKFISTCSKSTNENLRSLIIWLIPIEIIIKPIKLFSYKIKSIIFNIIEFRFSYFDEKCYKICIEKDFTNFILSLIDSDENIQDSLIEKIRRAVDDKTWNEIKYNFCLESKGF